jgi:hypothetical protein
MMNDVGEVRKTGYAFGTGPGIEPVPTRWNYGSPFHVIDGSYFSVEWWKRKTTAHLENYYQTSKKVFETGSIASFWFKDDL